MTGRSEGAGFRTDGSGGGGDLPWPSTPLRALALDGEASPLQFGYRRDSMPSGNTLVMISSGTARRGQDERRRSQHRDMYISNSATPSDPSNLHRPQHAWPSFGPAGFCPRHLERGVQLRCWSAVSFAVRTVRLLGWSVKALIVRLVLVGKGGMGDLLLLTLVVLSRRSGTEGDRPT